MSFDSIRHVVTSSTIPHEVSSTVRFTVDPSVVQVARELRRCVIAGLVCWTIVAVTRAVLARPNGRSQKREIPENTAGGTA